jgi:hypothetical protein
MLMNDSRLAIVVMLLGSALLATQSATAEAQQVEDPCVVRKEPSGLIRGDRVPSGCVLRNEEEPGASREDRDRPAIVCEETIFHTPLPKKSVLTNCVLLSRGRMLIPTVPPSNGKLGSVEREFGPVQRHFGPLERHFGPIQRHFGRSARDPRKR